ncbi:MAG: acylglycerol kinase family protein, partial [Bacteroidaceae bacterium]|nr:acylglycerol kinase family protein [Bacteroidaceae bacterium]
MIKAQNNNRHRWGIIYCPKVGVMKPMKRWYEIRDYLKVRGIDYDLIQSENFKSIERLSRVLADNGYETIVLVGGDGALQDAINGIMASPNRLKISFGLIPNG